MAVEPKPEAETSQAGVSEPPELCEADASGAFCNYVVADGDTVWGIAQKLGLSSAESFSAAELIAMSNGLNDSENWLITPGQSLVIPTAPGVVHTVAEGESASILASNFGVTTEAIVVANGLGDPNNVVVGQTVLVPSPSLWPLSDPAPFAVETTGDPEELAVAETATEDAAEGVAPSEATVESAAESTPEAQTPDAASLEVASARASGTANPSVSEIKDQFAAGYIAALGPPKYLEHILASVIACESGYNLRAFNPAGPYYGLMQFLPATWERMGGGDWADPWQQGHNTGVLLRSAYPQTQWPVCWG